MSRIQFISFAVLAVLFHVSLSRAADVPSVRTFRVPDAGVQPQTAVDGKGVVHLIYLAGDPSHADILYIRSTDGGLTFSKPLRVNSQPGSAMAIGSVRGAHLALGTAGRVHVGWFGSNSALPKALRSATPMLYTRLSEDGQSFEPQRNVIQSQPGLDGGGSIAADVHGNVYIAWHAPQEVGAGEQSRRVWLTRSTDEGKTFSPETAISGEGGACGCCGMRLLAADGSLFALYRTADRKIERDMTLLRLTAGEDAATSDIVAKMQSATCVMSTAALAANPHGGAIGAWESDGQIFWSPIKSKGALASAIPAPGRAGGRKHPALAANAAGQVLLVWTEGTGWNRGGTIAWQIYDTSGKPLDGGRGKADRLPVWGTPAAFAASDASFVVVY